MKYVSACLIACVLILANLPALASMPASYANASLPGMDFSGQTLSFVDFKNADLTGAHFASANLSKANFSNATLTDADFSHANLTGARFNNADLTGANLSGADLSGADLTNANLDHALIVNTRMEGAILTNADMSHAVHEAMPRASFVSAQAIGVALASLEKKIDLTINFDFNSDKLSKSGERQIKEIAAALNNAELHQARIMVEGHTDSIGSDAYNNDLSYRRAMRVARTLTEQYAIPAERLSSKGYGKTRPIASNDDDLGRAMNRRVTLVNLGN